MDLYENIQRLMTELDASIHRLRKNGVELAEAEKAYKMELTKEALRLRFEDMPVTLINQIVYGLEEVADLRLKRDSAKANYEANQEHINITKLKLRILESQLAREWGAYGNK